MPPQTRTQLPGEEPRPDHLGRIRTLQADLAGAGFEALLLFQSRDVFYYTGTAQPARLLVRPDDYLLFVKSGLDFVLSETPLDPPRIELLRGLEDVLARIRPDLASGTWLGTELDVLPAREYVVLTRLLEGVEVADCTPLIRKQRALKDDWELSAIREACRIVEAGHHRARQVLGPGMSELELAAQVETAHREAGHEGAFFIRQNDFFMSRGPLASGPNLARFSGVVYSITGVGLSSAMPVGPSRRIIREGDLVMIDVPVMSRGYHADMARTYHLGPILASTVRMFQHLVEIYGHALESIVPGRSGAEIFQSTLKKAGDMGEDARFLSLGPGRRARLIGHSIGLDVNEPPVVATWDQTPLAPGNVLAVEIHLADPDGRVVKLEDMILVTETGHQVLTDFPWELIRV